MFSGLSKAQQSGALGVSASFRSALAAKDEAATKELLGAYQAILNELEGLIETTAKLAADPKANPNAILANLKYKQLMQDVAREMQNYAKRSAELYAAMYRSGVSLGANYSAQMIAAEVLNSLDPPARVSSSFQRLDTEKIISTVGFTSPNSPLLKALERAGEGAAKKISGILVNAVALGFNPVKTAREMRKAIAQPAYVAIRTARTVQHYAAREATRANYIENSDVVKGWQWYTMLDPLTCMSCVEQHGKIFPNHAPLDDHYNGRCVMLPVTSAGAHFQEGDGVAWFENLSDAQKRKMLGPGKYELYKKGGIKSWGRTVPDKTWGSIRVERPLWQLKGLDKRTNKPTLKKIVEAKTPKQELKAEEKAPKPEPKKNEPRTKQAFTFTPAPDKTEALARLSVISDNYNEGVRKTGRNAITWRRNPDTGKVEYEYKRYEKIDLDGATLKQLNAILRAVEHTKQLYPELEVTHLGWTMGKTEAWGVHSSWSKVPVPYGTAGKNTQTSVAAQKTFVKNATKLTDEARETYTSNREAFLQYYSSKIQLLELEETLSARQTRELAALRQKLANRTAATQFNTAFTAKYSPITNVYYHELQHAVQHQYGLVDIFERKYKESGLTETDLAGVSEYASMMINGERKEAFAEIGTYYMEGRESELDPRIRKLYEETIEQATADRWRSGER